MKQSVAVSFVALLVIGADPGIAQEREERQAQYFEIQQQARTQMEEARRQLEEAARTIARSGANGDFDFDFDYEFFRNSRFNSAQIGISIADAATGALVTRVTPGQGAEVAGVEVGDIIQSMDGVDLTAGEDSPTAELLARLREVEPGDTVALSVERAGQTLLLDAETSEGPAWISTYGTPDSAFRMLTVPPAAPAPFVNVTGPAGSARGLNVVSLLGFAGSRWGDMELVTVSEELGRYFDTTEGLLVVSAPDDDAIDIQDGDVILEISGRVPNSPEHAVRILSSFEANETIELSIMRDGQRQTVEYDMAADEDPVLPSPD
jgi:hypothetical protein